MLRAVPSGKSFFGCGTTTTIPPFLNLWCEPLTLTSLKPSALRRLTISWLLRGMRNNIHTPAVQPQPAQRTAHLMKPVTDPKTTRLYDRHSRPPASPIIGRLGNDPSYSAVASGTGRNGRHRSVSSWAGAVSSGELR